LAGDPVPAAPLPGHTHRRSLHLPASAGVIARILFNLLQVAVVMIAAPLAAGVLARLKEMVQSKRGPSIFQPYRDLWKLFHDYDTGAFLEHLK
jgi:hypothetical protein